MTLKINRVRAVVKTFTHNFIELSAEVLHELSCEQKKNSDENVTAKQLNVVFCAIVMSRILFALPAWGGFLSYDLVAKFDAFFKKSSSLGLQQ